MTFPYASARENGIHHHAAPVAPSASAPSRLDDPLELGRNTVYRRTFTRTLVAAALATTLAAAAGCSDDSDDAASGSGGAQSLEKVTYLTSFGNFGRDSYAYVAKEKGYFKDAGFDVDIKPGGGTVRQHQGDRRRPGRSSPRST